MSDTIDRIIAAEWQMFDQVRGTAGRAPCQDDLRSFVRERGSQFAAWDEPLRASYEADLAQAARQGRNLLMEKYAFMAERSAPEEFRRMETLLPGRSPRKRQMVDALAKTMCAWQREVARRWPHLTARGRNLQSTQDRPDNVSFESYLRGELATYSEATLAEYLRYTAALSARGENLCENILARSVRSSGYRDLEEAERELIRRSNRKDPR